LQWIPLSRKHVTGERFAWIGSLSDYTPIKRFDGDAFRRKVGCRTKRLHRSPFAVQRNGHPSIRCCYCMLRTTRNLAWPDIILS
jgi:hypothetical protein